MHDSDTPLGGLAVVIVGTGRAMIESGVGAQARGLLTSLLPLRYGWTNPQGAADEQGTKEDEHARARPGNGIECCAVRIAPHQAPVVHEA